MTLEKEGPWPSISSYEYVYDYDYDYYFNYGYDYDYGGNEFNVTDCKEHCLADERCAAFTESSSQYHHDCSFFEEFPGEDDFFGSYDTYFKVCEMKGKNVYDQ